MPKFLEKIRRFLRTLQRSDEARKKRWLKIFTGAAMVIVLSLWLVYINVSGVPALVQSPKAPAKSSGESVLEIFRRGLNEIFSSVKSQLDMSKKTLQEQLQKTNELVIENATSTATSTVTSTETQTNN
jgi:hypothetical protein